MVQMCEYAMGTFHDTPMTIRRKLLAEMVQCKQMLHQPIPPGTYDINEV